MRAVWLGLLLASCGERCGSKPDVHADPPTSSSPSPVPAPPSATASATPSAPPSAAVPIPSAVATVDGDAACKSAHADALERYRAYCNANPGDCKDPDPDPLGNGSREPDLDGDGVQEIAWGWGPMPVRVETHVYDGKPGCFVHLATLPGNSSVHALATRHEGYADISAEDTSHCEGMCNCTPDVHVFVFKDGQYREDAKRHVPGTAAPCGPPP